MKQTSFPEVSAQEVCAALERIIPGVKHVTPDSIGEAVERSGQGTQWVLMPERAAGDVTTDPFAALTAQQVIDMVLSAGPRLNDELIVVTDDRFPAGLRIQADQISTVMGSDESWVGSDVVMIAPRQRRVIVIHHGGAYIHIGT